MSNYWQLRQANEIYNESLKKAEQELGIQYLRLAEKTKKDLLLLYTDIQDQRLKGEEVLVSHLYKFDKYYELLNNLNQNLNSLGLKEIAIYNDNLDQLYKANFELLGKSYNFSGFLNDQQVEKAINAIWCKDGKHWSNRVWNNKKKLQEIIQNGIIDCVAAGKPKEQMITRLMKDMSSGYSQADRIARTELSYVQNQSTIDRYKQAGFTKYQYLTADDCCSEICSEKDGQIFNIDEAVVGENIPPLHPNCRCSILAVIE